MEQDALFCAYALLRTEAGQEPSEVRFVSAGWVKPDNQGHFSWLGEHVIQFTQLSGLGGLDFFARRTVYIETCATGNEDGLFLFLLGRMRFLVEKMDRRSLHIAQSSSHTLWMNLGLPA